MGKREGAVLFEGQEAFNGDNCGGLLLLMEVRADLETAIPTIEGQMLCLMHTQIC